MCERIKKKNNFEIYVIAYILVVSSVVFLQSIGNMDEIKRIASSVPGALEIHAIRTRTSGNQLFVDMHLLVDPNMTVLEGHRIATEIKKRLLQNNTLFIRDVVVHIEP